MVILYNVPVPSTKVSQNLTTSDVRGAKGGRRNRTPDEGAHVVAFPHDLGDTIQRQSLAVCPIRGISR